jgi:cell wall-associated NlpC family hydrolase
MTRRPARGLRWLAMLPAVLLLAAGPLRGQGVAAEGAWYSGSHQSYLVLSLGTAKHLSSPLSVTVKGSWYAPESGGGAGLVGLGVDLSLWRGGQPGLYLVAGLGGGFGFNGAELLWGSYSAGLGYDFRLFSAVGLGVEGRWKGLTQGNDEGVQVGIRLGGGMQRKGGSTAPATSPPPTTSGTEPVPANGAGGSPLAESVVATALGAMGTPYTWGGSSANGFDCSGLVQYAFGAHGFQLPRTSSEQARAGVEVERDLTALLPGDILTFSSSSGGKQVSHVGLYIGGGEFIHSATNGVQKSVLSSTDPYGKWWWDRWVGARRVVPM